MGEVIKLFSTKQERRNLSYQASVDAFIPEAMEYADSFMLQEYGPKPHVNNQSISWGAWVTRWDYAFHRRMNDLCHAHGIRTLAHQVNE